MREPLAIREIEKCCAKADQKIAEARSVLGAAKSPRTRLVISMPAEAAHRLQKLFADGGEAAEELKRHGVMSIDIGG